MLQLLKEFGAAAPYFKMTGVQTRREIRGVVDER